MKSLKTFNLDHDVIQLMRHSPNKSQLVCKAVRRWYKSKGEYRVVDVPDMTLIGVLQSRHYDCKKIGPLLESIRALISSDQE